MMYQDEYKEVISITDMYFLLCTIAILLGASCWIIAQSTNALN